MNWIAKATRLAIYFRDGRCVYCGRTLLELLLLGITITLDHLLPHSQGGSNKPDNLVTCCHDCNSRRADQNWQAFAVTFDEATVLFIEQTIQQELPRQRARVILESGTDWRLALRTAADSLLEG